MKTKTGITQRSAEDNFAAAREVDYSQVTAYSLLGARSAISHRGFYTYPTTDNPNGQWLEVWWTTDQRTNQVTDIFEDTRGLNRK